MKKFIYSIIAVSAIIFIGCTTDNTTENVVGGEETLISVSLAQTKTSLGNKIGDTYPVYWDDEDRIVVNGKLSDKAQIEGDRTTANFRVNAVLGYPRSVVYPYSESTTADKPIVEFLGEQAYTEGSFTPNSTPMCGYSTSANNLTLSHLAAILQFPVKASFEGVVLEKIVITSTTGAKLSGEFAVNCSSATISATANSKNTIIYSLPDNYTLSTSKASVFHIALPAINVGSCTIEFVERSGEKMVAEWSPNKPLTKGVVREFKEISYKRQVGVSIGLLPVEEDEFLIRYKRVFGNVRYSDGSPIAGVAVSDGFQVVATDSNGYYELEGVTGDTRYIYCSLPADVKVPTNEYGMPCYFLKYPTSSQRYDFTFEKLAGGKEEEFALLALADTQVGAIANVQRLEAQYCPEIKNYSKEIGLPCYGLVLGDVIYSPAKKNNEYLLYEIRDAMSAEVTGVPFFMVFGNHDNAHFSESKPLMLDPYNSTINLKIQRPFEECFGPIDYSFNRSDTHIVCMRNIQWVDNIHPDGDHITTGFTDAQLEWLRQDLALVPKDKMIVFCVHIPIGTRTITSIQKMLTMLDEFQEVHILSGHLHYRQCWDHSKLSTGHKAFEQSWSSIHGTGWGEPTNLASDGAPTGYGVIKIKGNTITKSIHKGAAYGMTSEDYQIRLHRGGDITGAEISGTNKYSTKGYYQFPYDDSVVLANVFSSDEYTWTVEVWNYNRSTGKRTTKIGNMTSLAAHAKTPTYEQLIGSYTLEDPKRPAADVESGRDFWTTGVVCGYVGGQSDNYHICRTLWKFTLPDPTADIMVVARDQWGNEYTETEFQVGTDMGYALYDEQYNPK